MKNKNEPKKNQISAAYLMATLGCSCLANFVGLCIGHPIETIKVNIQTSEEKIIPFITRSLSQHGGLNLYKGFKVPLITYIPYYTLTFSLSKFLPHYIQFSQTSHINAFIQGAIAGAVGLCLYVPSELLKIRGQLAVDNMNYLREINEILTAQGVRGMYQGFWATFWREVPGWAFFFGVYDWAKGQGFNPYLSGGMAGFWAWFIAIPQDVLKTKIQNSKIPLSCIQATQQVYSEFGIRGFGKGGITLVARGVGINMVVLPLFDKLNDRFVGHNMY